MKFITTAKLDWFNDGCCDVRFLDMWNDRPLSDTFSSSDLDSNWHYDHYERVLGQESSRQLFQIAVDKLMRYRFYPTTVLSHTSDFGLQNRWVAVGDRIVQRIHLVRLFNRPLLDVIAMTEITAVLNEPRCIGFTYTTVDTHITQGSWSAVVEWTANDQVILSVSAKSRPAPQEPKRNAFYMRAFQRQAHQLGIAHFTERVQTAVAQPA